jgi:hypothetical protein
MEERTPVLSGSRHRLDPPTKACWTVPARIDLTAASSPTKVLEQNVSMVMLGPRRSNR